MSSGIIPVMTVTMTPSTQKEGVNVFADVLYLDEIPDVMDKMGWHVSAKMMRRWFSNKPAYKMTKDVRSGEFPAKNLLPSQYDDQIIKMDWALGYRDCFNAYSELASGAWMTERGIKTIRDRLLSVGWSKGKSIKLGSTRMTAIELESTCQINYKNFGKLLSRIDDMYGAIGLGFLKIAVVGQTDVVNGKDFFTVEKLGFYIRDTYDFTDNSLQEWTVSEPLGIWSKNRCLGKADSADYIAMFASANPLLIAQGMTGKFKGFVPVFNRSFRQWQDLNNSGGDFVVYSDVRWIDTPATIKIEIK